jgi:hypothetical protein
MPVTVALQVQVTTAHCHTVPQFHFDETLKVLQCSFAESVAFVLTVIPYCTSVIRVYSQCTSPTLLCSDYSRP